MIRVPLLGTNPHNGYRGGIGSIGGGTWSDNRSVNTWELFRLKKDEM